MHTIFIKTLRWVVSFGILTLYTAFLVMIDVESMHPQVHAQSISSVQTQMIITDSSPNFSWDTIKKFIEEQRTCVSSTQNFSQCTRRILLVLPIIIHVS